MLIISLLNLIVYGSLKKENKINTKLLNRIGLIILIISLIINIKINLLEEINIGKNLFNSILLINNFNNMLINIIYIIIILYILLISFKITNIEYIDNINYSKNGLIQIILFNMIGLLLLPLVNDIMILYILIELQSFSLYIITGIYNESYNSLKSGLFYFIIGSIASLMILDGTVSIYEELGLTNLNYIYMYINNINTYNILIIILGLLIKIGLAPLYNYLILIYTLSPTIITAYISLMPKLSILTLILILLNNISIINIYDINQVLILLIIISMIIGSIGGLKIIKIKTLLAYSSLLNVSYMLISIIGNNNESNISYIFYILQYSLTHINIFSIILLIAIYIPITTLESKSINIKEDNKLVLISKYSPVEYISQLKNLFIKNAYLATALSICLFSLIGLPPLIGFYGKYWILISALNNGYIYISIILVFVSSISCYYYAKIIGIMYFDSIKNNLKELNNDKTFINNNIISYLISILTLIILLIIIQYKNIIKGTYLVILFNIY